MKAYGFDTSEFYDHSKYTTEGLKKINNRYNQLYLDNEQDKDAYAIARASYDALDDREGGGFGYYED